MPSPIGVPIRSVSDRRFVSATPIGEAICTPCRRPRHRSPLLVGTELHRPGSPCGVPARRGHERCEHLLARFEELLCALDDLVALP